MRGRHLLVAVMAMTVVVASAQLDTTQRKKDKDVSELSLERFKFSDRRPAVGLFGGTTSFGRKDLSAPIENAIAFGIELGFRRSNVIGATAVTSTHSDGITISYHKGADVVAITPDISPQSINAFRIGVASRNGYGYKFGSGNEGVSFLHGSSALSWTVLNADDDSLAIATNQPLARFGSGLRFGEAWMPAIEFRVADPVSIQLQYTWAQVYPRHMFWYWLGSGTIEAVADGLTVWFVKEIGLTSPTVTPIMYFLLRNGVSAAFKALRANRMNWPFNTEAPLNMHTFSIGATVQF